jgi:hypothetical protein
MNVPENTVEREYREWLGKQPATVRALFTAASYTRTRVYMLDDERAQMLEKIETLEPHLTKLMADLEELEADLLRYGYRLAGSDRLEEVPRP